MPYTRRDFNRMSLLVQRYQRAGLVIFGKTYTPEYGLALTTENFFRWQRKLRAVSCGVHRCRQ